MAAWMERLRRLLSRFAAAREAVAAIEFALVLPIMLLVYIGGVEASSLISMDRRVQTITGSLGDLVARSDGKIVSATLQNYFKAAEGIMLPFSTAPLVQVVTSVQVMADGTTKVVWSRQYATNTMSSTGKARTVGQPYPLPVEITNISRSSYVIVSETYYSFSPVSNFVYKANIPLYRENFHVPRFGAEIKLDPP
ncbi:TadE/TadG family type IV pilus assembly protein [Devosia sp.]|uniref:TadE/TadG family type IV pilus assembly protein n=1 Tax=Devosia sp. TaxID=1871048 RepID=UPI0032653917